MKKKFLSNTYSLTQLLQAETMSQECQHIL